MKCFFKIILTSHILIATVFTSLLFAQENTHDGFFLRFLLGGGSGEVVEKDILGSDLTFSGLSTLFSFQLGGAVIDNFILFGTLNGYTMTDPDVEWSGYSGNTSDTEMNVSELGFGLNYYFMPVNLYIGCALTFPQATLKVGTNEGSTELGTGLAITIGKEWWVSANWGLGIAVFAQYGNMTSKESDGNEYDVNSRFLGLAFSATFN